MDTNRRHPSKEEVRAWMARRRVSSRAGLPLPTPDEIRSELGWHRPPVVRDETLMPILPLVLGELAALTAVVMCYWLLLQQPRERSQTLS